MAALYVLVMPALVLIDAGITVVLSSTLDAQGNGESPGTAGSIHGFSEVLYAFGSAANNNGSAFGGLTVTSDWFQSLLDFAMLLGRFLPIVFVLALAGLLARQRSRGVRADGLEPAPGQEVSRLGAGAPRASTSGQGRGDDAVSAGAPRTSTSGQGAADGDDADADSRGAVALEARTDTASTLPTHGLLFGALLFGTILLVAGLTFFPAMALGPIAEAAL